jgi:hypothetical protein
LTENNDDLADENQQPWGHTGASFDVLKAFTFEDAARAFVYDLSGRYVPSLPTKLTPEGQAFHDWLDVLAEAAIAESDALHVSIYTSDKTRQKFIQRRHLREWCERRKMRPKFLFQPTNDDEVVPKRASILKRSIHHIADLKALDLTKAYADKGLARQARSAIYTDEVLRLAQQIDSGARPAWAGAGANEPRAVDGNTLIVQMRDWLKNGRTTVEKTQIRENFVREKLYEIAYPVVKNEGWIKGLYVANEPTSDTAVPVANVLNEITHHGERASVEKFIGALVLACYNPKGGDLLQHGLVATILSDIEKKSPRATVSRETVEKWLKAAAERIR